MTTRDRLHPTLLLGPLAIAIVSVLATSGADAVPLAGSQGTDTSLAATDSQVTVQGRGTFADLAITVNQTDKLTNQAVSITWTGGQPTRQGPGRFASSYLQIMQCWGDDDGTVPENPGPPPEQCEQGAVAGVYGGLPGGLYPAGFALGRVISRPSWANFDASVGVLDVPTTNVWLPFRAVNGTVIEKQADFGFNPALGGGNFWLNTFYNIITTNEIAGGVTGLDGKGAELFQVLTGVQSTGLGCGQKVQPVAGGGKKTPQCWIVVVPRGTPTDENVGTPFEDAADQNGVVTSPVSPQAWQHRIAIPINFNPVDSPCALGVDERRLSGSELALPAVASWQPVLCTGGALPPFSYAPVSDAGARQQLVSKSAGAPGMVVVSKPLSSTTIDPLNPVVYAPLSASGVVIGFNIERNPTPDAPVDAQQIAGVRVADLNLTPRLLAKLLTQSYRGAVSIQGLAPPDYPWLTNNPANMGLDPEFVRYNPEFAQLQIGDSRTFSGLEMPEGNSDAAQQVWEYVLADPEARAWLDGAPDEFGMKVNPRYATTAPANSTGIAFADPLPSSFPKADPYCYQAPPLPSTLVPPPLCATSWMPYSRGFSDSAQITRVAADGARISENVFAQAQSDVWTRELPQFLGRRAMLSLTDTPSAALLGVQLAHLSRAGDDTPNRGFIAPDIAGLTAGVASMAPRSEPTVLEPTPNASAPDAYPLTTLTYAAITPLALDTQARSDYAAFLDYASGPGQVTGLDLGQLPRGYAPLPSSLRAQSASAADIVRTLVAVHPPAPEPSTTTSEPPTTPVAPTPTAATPTASPRATKSKTTTSTNPTTTTTVLLVTSTTGPGVTTTTEVPTASTTSPTTTTTISPGLTPDIQVAGTRFAVAALGVLALGSGLGALEITKRPRRRKPGGPFDDLDESGED
jgi:hypothetical protein